MAVLGIDFGRSKIGLAFSEGFLARPYNVFRNDKNFFNRLKEICTSQKVEKIVIGLPEGENQAKTKEFAKNVRKETGLPTFFVNETMSTKVALTRLIQSGRSKKYRRKAIDASAAAVILESYLSQNQSMKKDEI